MKQIHVLISIAALVMSTSVLNSPKLTPPTDTEVPQCFMAFTFKTDSASQAVHTN